MKTKNERQKTKVKMIIVRTLWASVLLSISLLHKSYTANDKMIYPFISK